MVRRLRLEYCNHFYYSAHSIKFSCAFLFTFIILLYWLQFNTSDRHKGQIIQHYKAVNQKPHLVMGILSSDKNIDSRNAQRNTWISTIIRLKNQLPFQITYRYLIDRPTNASIVENDVYHDILFLNVTNHGRANKFGEKLYVWLKYIHRTFPDALLAAKLDDDVFLCIPQILRRLYELKSHTLYYGWKHGNQHKINFDSRCDEMFVVLGSNLIKRIAERKYCGSKKCAKRNQLVDTNYGGTSLGVWLSIYEDINLRADNNRMFTVQALQASGKQYTTENFCNNYFLFHKSSPKIMNQLFKYDKILDGFNQNFSSRVSTDGAVTGSMFSGIVVRNLSFMLPIYKFKTFAYRDNMIDCNNWAVVTTIFFPSRSIQKIANITDWCLVIVADIKTPPRDKYLEQILTENNRKRVKYLTVKEQESLYPLLSKYIPFNSFGRKNIGYMYAIHHRANLIWDFDDDNDGIINLNDHGPGNHSASYVTECSKSQNILVNPYLYFGVRETRIWPRGFPLQSIRDNRTIPKVCEPAQRFRLGIIQSLANGQPDVDAIYRLTREVPFNFLATKESHRALVISKNKYAPFNSQATLWFSGTFDYIPLPISVNGRVSDIWRSYIAQHFMHRFDIKLAFTSPYVIQERNSHTLIRDFNGELDLYQKSLQLVDFLSSSAARDLGNITQMYENLYMRKYVQQSDINFIKAWGMTLSHIRK